MGSYIVDITPSLLYAWYYMYIETRDRQCHNWVTNLPVNISAVSFSLKDSGVGSSHNLGYTNITFHINRNCDQKFSKSKCFLLRLVIF